MSRIFINYRRQDSEGYVGRLYDYLAQHFERGDIFMDVDSIKPGADFVTVLEEAVANCDVFLAIIGPQWSSISDASGNRRLENWNDFVRIEIASALKQNKLVIPVLVGSARMPSPDELPTELTPLVRRNAIEISHQRFAYDVERLASAMKAVIDVKPVVTTPIVAKPREASPEKEALFKAVRSDLLNATSSPLYAMRSENGYLPVVGDGNLDAKIMFLGAAPGNYEAIQGRPFSGPAGDVLDEMLNTIQLKREDVFMTNFVLDYPGKKRDPTAEEVAFYKPFLDRLLAIVQPAVIVTLGGLAMDYVIEKLNLPEKGATIGRIHG
ncbi:MAG: uracil-DNA glycosylase family protein [Aggregatilineales bacterium]